MLETYKDTRAKKIMDFVKKKKFLPPNSRSIKKITFYDYGSWGIQENILFQKELGIVLGDGKFSIVDFGARYA